MLTEATVSTEGNFSTTGVRTLFPARSRPPNSSTDMFTYDVTRDGKRFLVNQTVKPERPPPLGIVLHATGLPAKRLVSTLGPENALRCGLTRQGLRPLISCSH